MNSHRAPPPSPTSGNQLPTTDAVGKAASEVSSGFPNQQMANHIYAYRQSKHQNKRKNQRVKQTKKNIKTNMDGRKCEDRARILCTEFTMLRSSPTYRQIKSHERYCSKSCRMTLMSLLSGNLLWSAGTSWNVFRCKMNKQRK